MYFDEDMILDIRMNILSKYVKKFIIIESKFLHSGKPKKLNFDKNKDYLDHKEKESSLPYIFENWGSIFTEHPIRNKIVYEDGTYVRAVWPDWPLQPLSK